MFTITLDQNLIQASQKKMTFWGVLRTNIFYVLWPMALGVLAAHYIISIWRLIYAVEWIVKMLEVDTHNDNHSGQ